MTRKRLLICAAILLLVWLCTKGVHTTTFVRAYCHGHDRYEQPEVYVFMKPTQANSGIPAIYTHSRDVLPYPLEIAVTVDDTIPGDGAIITSLVVEFADGEVATVVESERPRGGPFGKFEPVPSDKISGRTFRRARIGIPSAIWGRGSFTMQLEGYIYGETEQEFSRTLRMDYSRETNIYTGWYLSLTESV